MKKIKFFSISFILIIMFAAGVFGSFVFLKNENQTTYGEEFPLAPDTTGNWKDVAAVDLVTYNFVTNNGGDGISSPYKIRTAEELAFFSYAVNTNTDFGISNILTAKIEITSNINLAGKVWTPISTSSRIFSGNFDGKDHIISNMTIINGSNFSGLFAYFNGHAQNVNLESVYIKGVATSNTVAAFCGKSSDVSTYLNIQITSTQTRKSYIEGYFRVGGIVAVGGKSFNSCKNYAIVKATSTASSVATYYSAGIVSYVSEAENFIMENCENYGEIIGASYSAGLANLDSKIKPGITDSKNFGKISGFSYVSGLVNMSQTYSENNVVLADCENRGNISATADNVAGVIYASGNLVSLTNCINKGNIDASSSNFVSGIVVAPGLISSSGLTSVILQCKTLETEQGDIPSITGKSYVSGICSTGAASIGTSFIDCINEGAITAMDSTVGGIATGAHSTNATGPIGSLSFIRCENYGIITNANNFTGGIAARVKSDSVFTECKNFGEVKSNYSAALNIGGIVGSMLSYNTFTECENNGIINSEGKSIGGIAGNIESGAVNNAFNECKNTSSITGTNANIGGLVGLLIGSADFNDCENSGDINSTTALTNACVGGFVGHANSTVTVNFNRCENSGDIGSETILGASAGFIGQTNTYGGTYNFDSCENNGQVKGNIGVGGYVGNLYGSYSSNVKIYIFNSVNTGNIFGIDRVAGFIGESHFVHIENSHNEGKIEEYDIKTNTSSYCYFGGLVGRGQVEVIDCFNSGDIINKTAIGNVAIGGLVGLASSASTIDVSLFVRSYNTGNVTGVSYVGGIFGSSINNAYVSECYNSGNISGGTRVGGIVGNLYVVADGIGFTYEEKNSNGEVIARYSAVNKSVIVNCFNTGSVTATTSICGGLVGYLYFPTAVEAQFDTAITIESCYSSGVITCPVTSRGGVVGQIVYGTNNPRNQTVNIINSYFLKDIAVNEVINLYGSTNYSLAKPMFYNFETSKSLTSSEITVAASFIGWDFSVSSVWGIWVNNSVNNGMPYLKSLVNFDVATVSFNTLGGSDIFDMFTGAVGQTISISGIINPSKKGYTFDYWETEEGIEIIGGQVFLSKPNMMLYAVWTPIQYNIVKEPGSIFKIFDGGNVERTYITIGANFRFEANANNGENPFASWQVYNVKGDRWETILGTNVLYLLSIVDSNFIDNYVDESDNILIQTIYTKAYLVRFDVMNSEFATILINDRPFSISNNEILFIEGQTEINLSITPKSRYYLKRILIDGTPVDSLIFDATTVTLISIEIEAITYNVIVSALDSENAVISSIRVFDSDTSMFEVQINDSFNGRITAVMPNAEFRFLGYKILNPYSGKYESILNLDGSLNLGLIDEAFLLKYLNTSSNQIIVVADFIEQFYVYIDIPFEMKDMGTLSIVLETQGQIYSPISINGYFDRGTKISIKTIGKTAYSPDGFMVNGVLVDSIEDFRLEEDMEIFANFIVTTYSVLFKVVDWYNVPISLAEITFNSQKGVTGLSNGDVIENILRPDLSDRDYEFIDWFCYIDGTLYPFVIDAVHNRIEISTILMRERGYNNQLIIYAKYTKLYELAISKGDSGLSYFIVEKFNGTGYDVLTNFNGAKFTTETKIRITALASDFFTFKQFNGVSGDELLSLTVAEINMIGSRYITIDFSPKEFVIDGTAKTDNAKGEFVLEQEKLKYGDVIILTFNVESGYQLSSWKINGKDVNLLSNAKLSGNTVRLTITEPWLIEHGARIHSEIETTINQVYLIILLATTIGVPLLFLIIVALIVVNSNRNKKIKQMIIESKMSASKLNYGAYVESLRQGNSEAAGGVTKEEIKNYKKKK